MNQVSVQLQSLLVQLSWRVTPPFGSRKWGGPESPSPHRQPMSPFRLIPPQLFDIQCQHLYLQQQQKKLKSFTKSIQYLTNSKSSDNMVTEKSSTRVAQCSRPVGFYCQPTYKPDGDSSKLSYTPVQYSCQKWVWERSHLEVLRPPLPRSDRKSAPPMWTAAAYKGVSILNPSCLYSLHSPPLLIFQHKLFILKCKYFLGPIHFDFTGFTF